MNDLMTESLVTLICVSLFGLAWMYLHRESLTDLRHRKALTDRTQPDIDICASCGEHCEFEYSEGDGWSSNCCSAGPINTDPDCDMER